MPVTFASPEWIDALWSALRTDEHVRTTGALWVHGPVLVVVEAQPDRQFPVEGRLLIDLHGGETRDVSALGVGEERLAPCAIAGPYERWKQVLRGTNGARLDVVDAVIDGKLHLRGDLAHIARHRPLIEAVVDCAARIDTAFPDEVAEQPVVANSPG